MNTTMSFAEIGRKYNRHRSTVAILAKAVGATRDGVGRGITPLAEASPLSIQHRRLGVRITRELGEMTPKEAADRLGISVIRLRQMELGVHDFTLLEMLKLEKFLGIEMSEMILPMRV